MLLGTLLTNADSWINVTQKDIEALEKPDTFLQRSVPTQSGNHKPGAGHSAHKICHHRKKTEIS